jgi:imidazolonepropionase-like amidohydrolase
MTAIPDPAAPDPAAPVTIAGAAVFDGHRLLPARDVTVHDGLIATVTPANPHPDNAIPSAGSATVMDGRGRTLLPGLFDAHVHLEPDPERALRHLVELGVTTALDMFCGASSLVRIGQLRESDPPDLASVRTAGTGATAPGNLLEKLTRSRLPTIASPAEADAWVAARLAEGSDYIKIVYDEREGGPLDQSTLAALVRAAHAHGVLAVAHTLAEQPARQAIAAGIDGLVHLFVGPEATSATGAADAGEASPAGADFGMFAADRGVFVVPTLAILHGLCGYRLNEELAADPRLAPQVERDRPPFPIRPLQPGQHRRYAAAVAALRQLVAAGVPVLAGTDTGLPTAALGVFGYGAALHGELELLVRAGLTPTQALTAATAAPAKGFRLGDRGEIRPGARADLLLVDGDPTTDIRATRDITAVWKRGVRLSLP